MAPEARSPMLSLSLIVATTLGCPGSPEDLEVTVTDPAVQGVVRGDGLPCALYPADKTRAAVRLRLFMRGPRSVPGAARIVLVAADESRSRREQVHTERPRRALKPRTWTEVRTGAFRLPDWADVLVIETEVDVEVRGRRRPLPHRRWCWVHR